MLRKFLSLSLAITMVLSMISVPVMAAPATLIDVDFVGNTINESAPGVSWTRSANVSLSGDALQTNDGWIELSNGETSPIIDTINNDRDFYTSFKLSFSNWGSDQVYVLRVQGSGDAFGIMYDKDYSPTGAWRIRLTNAATPGTYTSYNINDNLSLGTEYDVTVAKDGSDLKIYRDGDLIGSLPIGFSDLHAPSDSWTYVGINGSDSRFELKEMKFVGDSTYTPGGEEVTSVGVTGDDLDFTPDGIVFSSVKIDNGVATNSTASSKVKVDDKRGNGGGWVIQAAGTKFVSELVNDPTSGGTGQISVAIPVSAMNLSVGAPTLLSGQAVDGVNGPVTNSITMSSSAQTIITAQPGFGMGAYEFPLNFTLTVPKTGTVETVTGSGSKYTVGDSVGIVAGTYWGKITYTVAAPL